ncbi:hypothetical protein HYH68_16305 [Clostridium botulinum]|nr:hypothetical protein [Clostridium botulinum]
MEANSIDEIKSKAEEELNELVDDYKKKRKDIFRKKNLQIKKFKEQQAQKLGYLLFDFFETTDVNKVLEELKLQDKIIIK